MTGLYLACCFAATMLGAEPSIRPDLPNTVRFPVEEARFVRFMILAADSGEPCLDELEVYGPAGKENLALATAGAKASASSCLSGYRQHAIEHLNDGNYGNPFSWIAASRDVAWAQIELPQSVKVDKVVFSRDRNGQYVDRVPTNVEVLVSADGMQWKSVQKVVAKAATVAVRRHPSGFAGLVPSPPPPPRMTNEGVAASQELDEIEVYGQKAPIPLDAIGPLPQDQFAQSDGDEDELLRYAFLSEEHAWLKTYGRADLSPRLVPYNGRVKEYPRHVGDDRLPLPPLASLPTLDGQLDDACWRDASRGVVRVVSLGEFKEGPLVATSVHAGWHDEQLFLAIQTDRLLSGHVAVLSTSDGRGCGAVAFSQNGLVFNTYVPDGPRKVKLDKSRPIEAAFDATCTCCEIRLPLAWFPDCREHGLRVGLGIGGRHTLPEGRPVHFAFSELAMAQVGPCVDRQFLVRLAVAPGGKPVKLEGELPELSAGLTLQPGKSCVLTIPASQGAIGPQYDLTVRDQTGEEYSLHLFRYDPLERTLVLMDEMLDRLAAKKLNVDAERTEWAEFRARQLQLLKAPGDLAAERLAFLAARKAKRRLLLREPELKPIEQILFVKRHAYEPSHNYSVMLDSRYRPGGSVGLLRIPRVDGRYEPGRAVVKELFDAGEGIARDPMASFDSRTIYFAHRPSADGYFHVMRMDPDGANLTQLTDGPFHDYWPCPLPDGGLAMISSRCRARFLCWRPQAMVLFRMDADGNSIRPLSYANLSEWGPSVTRDGRIIWQRSEYIDKGADFSHTLWTIRPDGSMPELVFGNDIIQPNGYANGREVPGTRQICCTLISHFGDLNGPIALLDIDKGRFNPQAIASLTPEVPWPGMWPAEEYFRDPFPIARDYVLCSHAPRERAGLCVIDRFGNREVLHLDRTYGCMTPTPYRAVSKPPVFCGDVQDLEQDWGQFVLVDVYRGIDKAIARGSAKYLRVVEEVRAGLEQLPSGEYRKDHDPFMHFYAAPVDRVSGPYGWPSYVAKTPWGLVPIEEDGSANFLAPAGKQLYFQILDKDLNELQRMRSVVQVQPGEKRSCIGCHEDRRHAPPARMPLALNRAPSEPQTPPWGAGPFSYEQAVQPVFNAKCVQCHDSRDQRGIDLTGTLDIDRIPASYKTLIRQGWVHVCDYGYNSGGNEKKDPLTFGTLKSRLWDVLQKDHHDAKLTRDEMHAIKCWIDMNCPLWPDYQQRELRPGPANTQLTQQ